MPADATDYWPTASWRGIAPAALQMDGELLEKMRTQVKAEWPHLRGMIVVRRGCVVFEYSRAGLDADTLHPLASITKTVTATLVGAAIQGGSLRSVDQFVGDFLMEAPDPWRTLRLRHLLTLTTGLEWSEAAFRPWTVQDQLQLAWQQTRAGEPGVRFNYNTPAIHVLSAVLSRATGRSAESFAGEELFGPLGITSWNWPTDECGHSFGGFGLMLGLRDLAKLGLLYLGNGVWDGRRILPAGWVGETTRRASEGGPPEGEAYGQTWWLTEVSGHAAYFASGFGGQYLFVVPDLDLLVGMASEHDRPHLENRLLIRDYIVPSAEGRLEGPRALEPGEARGEKHR